jgi:hypothetical protein
MLVGTQSARELGANAGTGSGDDRDLVRHV